MATLSPHDPVTERIVELRESGYSLRAIARMMGFKNYQSVQYRLERRSNAGAKGRRHLCASEVTKLRNEAYHRSAADIARRWGLSRQHVARVIRGCHHKSNPNPPLRPVDMHRSPPPHPQRKLSMYQVTYWRKQHHDGMSIREVSRRCGLSYVATRLMLRGETYKVAERGGR